MIFKPAEVGWRLGRAYEPRGGELWVPWDRQIVRSRFPAARHADEVAGALDDSSGAGEHPEPDGST
jgi:hypothetical protein